MTHKALEAVGELIKAQRMRIDITATIGYTVTAPCLLAQLAEAVAMGGEGAGGRSVPGSRPTIAVDALDLWVRVVSATHSWAQDCEIERREPAAPHATPWIGRLLRSAAATAISTGKLDMADRIAHNAEGWAREIRAMLTGEVEQRGIRGATCPECVQIRPYPLLPEGPRCGWQPTMWIRETREEERRRPEVYQMPAIVLVTRDVDGVTLRWLTCLACGWNEPLSDDTVVLAHVSESLDTDLAIAS